MALTKDDDVIKDWPRDATRFSGRIRTTAATLRKAGIDITFSRPERRLQP